MMLLSVIMMFLGWGWMPLSTIHAEQLNRPTCVCTLSLIPPVQRTLAQSTGCIAAVSVFQSCPLNNRTSLGNGQIWCHWHNKDKIVHHIKANLFRLHKIYPFSWPSKSTDEPQCPRFQPGAQLAALKQGKSKDGIIQTIYATACSHTLEQVSAKVCLPIQTGS